MLRAGAQREMNVREAGCSHRTAAPGAQAACSRKDLSNWGLNPFPTTSRHPTSPRLN